MCCFSEDVEIVANTSIFARGIDGKQVLVYSMTYAAEADLAMILPLPVPPNPPEDAVTFINLEGYPDFFEAMNRGFSYLYQGKDETLGGVDLSDAPKLEVHEVGSFEASFVPRIKDFERLDERFRLPSNVWDALPAYRDYGFAVFKLKGTKGTKVGGHGARTVHPMAFVFPRRDPDRLFFPTVHVHDGEVHPTANFDHFLYFQLDRPLKDFFRDVRGPMNLGAVDSSKKARNFMAWSRTNDTVDPDQEIWRLDLSRYLFGYPLGITLENTDTLIGKDGYIPQPIPDAFGLRDAVRSKNAWNAEWAVTFFVPMEHVFCCSEGEVDRLLAKDGRNAQIYRMSSIKAASRTFKKGEVDLALTRAQWLSGKR